MKNIYFMDRNAQTTGMFEVHKEDCPSIFFIEESFYLGEFYSCEEAMGVARRLHPNVDGCAFYCRRCHTK
jgi:hypothetical protein